MATAFVLSGGANLGAGQVGMLTALEVGGVTPDLVIGTSVDAFDGAWVAARSDLTQLGDVWRSLRRRTRQAWTSGSSRRCAPSPSPPRT